jgi:hypothetical protein
LIETVFPAVVRVAHQAVSQVFLEAWNHRVGVKATGPDCEGCKPIADVLYAANQSGIAADALFAVPESDSWTYSQQWNNGTKTMASALVCDVFVCRMWKAGGLFDSVPGGPDTVNCGEFTNWDAYVLKLLAPPKERPKQCVAADPHNPLCQLMGGHTMELNDLTTKDLYPHFAEKCPGLAPSYERPPRC